MPSPKQKWPNQWSIRASIWTPAGSRVDVVVPLPRLLGESLLQQLTHQLATYRSEPEAPTEPEATSARGLWCVTLWYQDGRQQMTFDTLAEAREYVNRPRLDTPLTCQMTISDPEGNLVPNQEPSSRTRSKALLDTITGIPPYTVEVRYQSDCQRLSFMKRADAIEYATTNVGSDCRVKVWDAHGNPVPLG